MNKNDTHTENFAKTAIILMLLSLVGRGLGLVRESILASKFGASFQTDAYKVAFSIPTLLLVTLSASVATTLIPVYTDIIKHKSKKTAQYYIINLMNIVILISYVITTIGIIFTPLLVKIIAPGFQGEVFYLAVRLCVIMIPSIIFYSLTNLSEGLLQANKIFAITAFTAIPFNLFIIGGILLPGNKNIEAVAIGSLLAVISQFVIQIPLMKKTGFRYKLSIDFKDEDIRKTFNLMIPVFISSTFSQANIFINRMLASVLAMGSISALDYADKANNILYNIIISPIILIIYPRLSFLHDDIKEFCSHIMTTLNTIIFIAFPTAAILMVLRVPIIQILYERGIFSRQDTLTTSTALGCFAIGIPGICIYALLTKAFYSMKDTRTPMTNDIFTVVLNIVLSLIFVKHFGVGGLALSVSIASTIGCVIMLVRLKKKVDLLYLPEILETVLQAFASSYLSGGLIYIVYRLSLNFLPDEPSVFIKLSALTLIVSVGIITYIGLLYYLKVKELNFILKYIRKIRSRQ